MTPPRKAPNPAEAWTATIEQASPDWLLAALLAKVGPVELTPGEVIAADGHTAARDIAVGGTVRLFAVDTDGNTVHPDQAVRNPLTGEPLGDGEMYAATSSERIVS
jgi:hypothetical protein